MKNLYQYFTAILLLLFICTAQCLTAQVTSKAVFLNGNFSFDNNHTITGVKRKIREDYEMTRNQIHLNSSLGLGYTFFNRLILGGAFNYNFRRDQWSITLNYHTFSWGPFGRLYLINKKAGLFTEVKYLKGQNKDIGGYNGDEVLKGTVSTLRYGIGGNYFVTKRLSLELLAAYQKEKRIGELKPNTDPTSNTRVSIDSKTLLINFGISYFIKAR